VKFHQIKRIVLLQKTFYIENAYRELRDIWKNFQHAAGYTNQYSQWSTKPKFLQTRYSTPVSWKWRCNIYKLVQSNCLKKQNALSFKEFVH